MDIKSVVKEHGLTLVQVAEGLGITKGGLSQSINGNPTIGTLRSIADAVGCKVGDFFRDEVTSKEEMKEFRKLMSELPDEPPTEEEILKQMSRGEICQGRSAVSSTSFVCPHCGKEIKVTK